MPHIVIPDDDPPVYQGHPELERLRTLGEVTVYHRRATSPEEFLERLRPAGIVLNVRAYSRFSREVLEALPRLRLISVLGTGTDNIDLEAATALGIVVTNTPGASTVSVAELTIALMLAAARHLAWADRTVRAGRWEHRQGSELRGKTLGIIGLGAIGQEVARLARGLGLRVIAWSFTPDPARAAACGAELVDLETLLTQADIVSLHLRASPRSVGLLDRQAIFRLKRGAILINTARGALVDEEALADALEQGHLAAAGLDVFAVEPLPPESRLRRLENVVLSPHMGWVTAEASARLTRLPVDNIAAYLAGQPTCVVNPAALAHPRQRG